jgi:preprotein translocase subunit SecA
MAFDRRTHRQAWRRYDRLNYAFLAAQLMESTSPQVVTADVLEHLEEAREVLEGAWGKLEFTRLALANTSLSQFDETLRGKFVEMIGGEHFEEIREQPLNELNAADAAQITTVLGKRIQNEIYRSLLLTSISEQWVEYLTKVEALRVSIGMEAYAQRDPLVQYKGRASELFTTLLADIRAAVIARMYTMQPRRSNETAVEKADAQPVEAAGDPAARPAAPNVQNSPLDSTEERKKKRKRH